MYDSVKITGAMRTHVIKPRPACVRGIPYRTNVFQPTDLMVYVKSEKGDPFTSGARRVYHGKHTGFFVKINKTRYNVNINLILQLLHSNILVYAQKGAFKRRL